MRATDPGYRALGAPGHMRRTRGLSLNRERQWRKWRSPVKTMAMPCSSAASITSASRIEPPGWTTASTPASAAASSPSRNGKKASLAHTPPAARPAACSAAMRRRVDPVLLAGADADGLAVLDEHDGVRRTPRRTPATPTSRSSHCVVGRRRLGDHLPRRAVEGDRVGLLHEQAAVDACARRAARSPGGGADSTRRFFLAVSTASASSSYDGRDDDLGEHRRQRLGQRARHRSVEGDDAAEGADAGRRRGRGRRRW